MDRGNVQPNHLNQDNDSWKSEIKEQANFIDNLSQKEKELAILQK